MKIVIRKNLKTFKQVIGIASKIGFETNINILPDCVKIAVPKGGDAICMLNFKKDFFDVVEGEGKTGINISDFNNAIKDFEEEVTITDTGNKLNMFNSKEKASLPIIIEVNGLEDMPPIVYDTTVSVGMVDLAVGIKKLVSISPETIIFNLKDNKFSIASENDMKSRDTVLKEGVPGNEKVTIGIDYITSFVGKSDINLTLSIKRNHPLLFTFTADGLKVDYMIACRIEEVE